MGLHRRAGALRSGDRPPILGSMDSSDLPDRIAALEDEIETLAEAVARSRRLVLLSRLAGWAGGGWAMASLTGLVPWDATGLVFAIGLGLGGMVFAGSSLGTIREAEQRMARNARLREQLIDAVAPAEIEARPATPPYLRLVPDAPPERPTE